MADQHHQYSYEEIYGEQEPPLATTTFSKSAEGEEVVNYSEQGVENEFFERPNTSRPDSAINNNTSLTTSHTAQPLNITIDDSSPTNNNKPLSKKKKSFFTSFFLRSSPERQRNNNNNVNNVLDIENQQPLSYASTTPPRSPAPRQNSVRQSLTRTRSQLVKAKSFGKKMSAFYMSQLKDTGAGRFAVSFISRFMFFIIILYSFLLSSLFFLVLDSRRTHSSAHFRSVPLSTAKRSRS
jgi:hypothetical protein